MKHAIAFSVAALLAAGLPAAPVAAELTEVEFQTTRGNFVLQVDSERAPETAANFLQYVRDEFYNGLIFHRVIPGFVIQGGGFTAEEPMAQKKTRDPVVNESDKGWNNERHTLSMARTSDPHSATSQFFINLVDNIPLDHKGGENGWGYAVFGKIIRGGEVIDKIGAVETGQKMAQFAGQIRPFQNVPLQPVVMTLVHILEKDGEGAAQ